MLQAVVLGLILQATGPSTADAPPSVKPEPKQVVAQPIVNSDGDTQLLQVKRIYVESFGDDAVSRQLEAMVISSLTSSKRFIVTENKDRADAILKGSALEKTSQEFHAYGESTSGGSVAGGHSGSVGGSWSGGTGSVSGSSSGGFAGVAAAIEDSAAHTETIDHARVAVRLLNRDGDVIWAATDESKGAKYKGAGADAADKIVKKLLRYIEKLEKPGMQAASEPN